MKKEIWKIINGYENYMISSFGRVKSLDRYVRGKNNSIYSKKGKLLKLYTDKDGHQTVMLYHNNKYSEASKGDIEKGTFSFLPKNQMPCYSYSYLISSMGQWYSITIKSKNHTITIKDSLKLMPFSLAEIGNAFKTKHKKLEMEYKGNRYSNCPITKDEEAYIKNDVYVLSEALQFMFNEGHTKMTIGACCMSEYKNLFKQSKLGIMNDFTEIFPNMKDIELDKNI